MPYFYNIPVIFLTGKDDVESEVKAFELGAVDYIQKPINQIILHARIKLHLKVLSYNLGLEAAVIRKTLELYHSQETTLNLLAHVTEFRDSGTVTHIKRTSAYACLILGHL